MRQAIEDRVGQGWIGKVCVPVLYWDLCGEECRSSAVAIVDDLQEITGLAIHARSRGTYGAPRIHAELRAQGIRVGRKRVARLMREAGLEGVSRRRKRRTTQRDPQAQAAPDLVERTFSVTSLDELWVADITYVPTESGVMYLAVVVDAFSRRVVGWAMEGHLRAELVLGALNMALWQRRPNGVIHHSDQGSQYTSVAFGKRCREAGIRLSMGSVGDCYDNALCESFFATLECELLDRVKFRNRKEACSEVFAYIEGWYNRQRRHSALGYESPVGYERKHAQERTLGREVDERKERETVGAAEVGDRESPI